MYFNDCCTLVDLEEHIFAANKAHISDNRHNWRCCTFSSWCTFEFRERKIWPILTNIGYFVEVLRTFWCTFLQAWIMWQCTKIDKYEVWLQICTIFIKRFLKQIWYTLKVFTTNLKVSLDAAQLYLYLSFTNIFIIGHACQWHTHSLIPV